jgi:hypothetical protein
MKRLLLTLTACIGILTFAAAQTARDEIKKNIFLSGGCHLAYPGPSQKKLTPPPAGKQPFYISHYGRHGSRYLIGKRDYQLPCEVLGAADSVGKLTELGKEVLQRVRMLRDEANLRLGELTPLGAQQHREIAQRMFDRFPEVFRGRKHIDAKSTVVIRCILSMENALLQLKANNPQLEFTHDASEHDMYYMNQNDRQLQEKRRLPEARKAIDQYCYKRVDHRPLMRKLFSDTAYVSRNVKAGELYDRLFLLASNLQSSELRKRITLYDLFSDEEIYATWQMDNARWYSNYGHNPNNGATQPFSQRFLLRNIISEADSCMRLPDPCATLRFGHDVVVLPLVCLMGLNGYDAEVKDFNDLEKKEWVNYRIFPMACNVQLVFYRSSRLDEDILVKVLLNENEATLPVKSDIAPYYRWKDVRAYFLDKLGRQL